MPSTSTYKGYTVPTNLGDAGVWGGYLNTTIGLVDANLGGVTTLYSSNGNVTLSSTQAANLAYVLSGTLTADHTVTFTSSLSGYGIFVIDNQETGAFATYVTQSSTGATALAIPQGGRSLIYGNGTTFKLADNNQTAKLYSYLGSPQGNVAGTAATANGGATDMVRDVTNQIDFACKTTGTSSTALWVPSAGLPDIGGYLTVSTDANNPVPTADYAGVSSVFWTPLTSNWMWASDGTAIFPVQFSRMTLTLTNTNNAASQIQDVYYFWNSGSPVIGSSPTWAAGTGGSVTAGACARGTGVGGTALTRVAGVFTNTVAMTINNGASSYSMGIGQGIYLGSIFIDTAAGQVTCHRSWGQSRKWGAWSAFNRFPVYLSAGDSTATWVPPNSASYRAANGSAANSLTTFCGLAEDIVQFNYSQVVWWNSGSANNPKFGIGYNSTSSPSGQVANVAPGNQVSIYGTYQAFYRAVPALGINVATALELSTLNGTLNVYGGEAQMGLNASWRA